MPIIHETNLLYKELYIYRKQIPKQDRFGIWTKIENIILDCLKLVIQAALTPKNKKLVFIQELKIKIEITKRLIRLVWELKIITDKKYFSLEQKLIQISKMASGWIKYLTK